MLPQSMEFYISDDGQNYRLFSTHDISAEVARANNTVIRDRIPLNLHTRYLRVVVKNPGLIPEGLPGAGYDSWIFMDELLIN